MNGIFTCPITVGYDDLDTLIFYRRHYISTAIEPKTLKMIILFGLVIHLLGIFPKEVKYQQDYIPKDLGLKTYCTLIMVFSVI